MFKIKYVFIFISLIIKPSLFAYTFHGQFKQDQYIFEHFFKNKKGSGVFFDIGAYDGIMYSNTYFFEKELGWRGVCIEPANYLFNQLKQNRKCICSNKCIWNKCGIFDFLQVRYKNGDNHGYSGLTATYDDRHKKSLAKYKTANDVVKVECTTFNQVCNENKIKHIDLLSIDTEGSEIDILKSIDFSKIYIDIITVENNFNEPHIKNLLISKGFKFIKRLGVDDVYKNFKKNKK